MGGAEGGMKKLSGILFVIMLGMSFNAAFQGTAIAQAGANNCYLMLESQQLLVPIRNKVPLAGGKPSLEMLANDAKPTKAEKKAIGDWEQGLSQCNEQAKNWGNANMNPQANQILQNNFSALRSLIADLYVGKISYGKFLKDKQANDSATSAQITEVAMKTQAENQRQAQIQEQSARMQRLQEESIEQQKRAADAINGATQYQQNQDMMNRGLYILKNGF